MRDVGPCFAIPNIPNRSGGNSISSSNWNVFASYALSSVTRFKANGEIVHDRYFQLVDLEHLRFTQHGFGITVVRCVSYITAFFYSLWSC